METLAPPLECVLRVKAAVYAGRSLRSELRDYTSATHNSLSLLLRQWLLLRESSPEEAQRLFLAENEYRQMLVEVLAFGLDGQPVLERLHALEIEFKKAATAELDLHLSQLPFKMLIPLFGFIFPAFLLLILGPMISDLLQALNS